MDDHDQYDSIQWERGTDVPQESPSPFPPTQSAFPSPPAGGQSSSSNRPGEAQAGNNADSVDLAGIGRDGVLEVTVDTPLKENDGTKDAYVSYLVSSHTNFKTFQRSNFSVRRRFTDFVFLRSSLHRDYPACAVPPLPDKNNMSYVRGDRFSTDFTQRRAWSLHRFIKRCTLHPVLRRAPILLLFLETADWNALMRPDKRFIEVTERTAKLSEDLSHIEKIISRVARRQGDLEYDYLDLATNMRKLTPLEPAIAAPLQTFAGCVEETSRGWKTLKDHTDQNYLGSLRDMESYIGSVKSLLKTREQKQLDFEGLTDYLQKATSEHDILASSASAGGGGGGGSHSHSHGASALNPAAFIRNKVEDMRGVDHETARKDRTRKLEVKIQELTREVESAKSTSEMFDDQVVREVADFDRIKGLEFRDALGGLATQNIRFYESVIHTWERFLADMDVKQDTGKVPAR
ncbi:hypothetical protein DV736_g5922, partial [Chaetothyriales sp. CBS 134916]